MLHHAGTVELRRRIFMGKLELRSVAELTERPGLTSFQIQMDYPDMGSRLPDFPDIPDRSRPLDLP